MTDAMKALQDSFTVADRRRQAAALLRAAERNLGFDAHRAWASWAEARARLARKEEHPQAAKAWDKTARLMEAARNSWSLEPARLQIEEALKTEEGESSSECQSCDFYRGVQDFCEICGNPV